LKCTAVFQREATEYAGQGLVAVHFTTVSHLRCPNRIVKVIAGIALAMGFLHSRCITDGDLKSENILLDWDWSVRMTGFGRSRALFADWLRWALVAHAK
jgi:serine/threonine protein kinase